MGRLGRVIKSLFTTRSTAPGKAVVVTTASAGSVKRTAEMYHPPGVSSAPTAEDRVVEVPIGNSGSRVIVASHNYRVEVEPSSGETIIYSTNSAGDTVQAQLKLDNDGNILLNGDSKTFVTHAELDSALQGLITYLNGHAHSGVTTGGGTSGPPASPTSLDISAAETTTVKTGG